MYNVPDDIPRTASSCFIIPFPRIFNMLRCSQSDALAS